MKLLYITDFFDRLLNYSNSIPIDKSNYRYGNHECERDVFVRRSLKSYRGKYFVIYDNCSMGQVYLNNNYDEINYLLKKYIFVYNLSYMNSYSGQGYKISITYFDATEPLTFKTIDLTENKFKNLIGRTSNKEEYSNVSKLFTCDLPNEEYIVHAYDWSKAHPNGHTKKNIERAKMTFKISGRTEDEAITNARKYCRENKFDFNYMIKI